MTDPETLATVVRSQLQSLRCALDAADCEQRDGAKGCRVDKPCWRCRAEAAEAARDYERSRADRLASELRAADKRTAEVRAESIRQREALVREHEEDTRQLREALYTCRRMLGELILGGIVAEQSDVQAELDTIDAALAPKKAEESKAEARDKRLKALGFEGAERWDHGDVIPSLLADEERRKLTGDALAAEAERDEAQAVGRLNHAVAVEHARAAEAEVKRLREVIDETLAECTKAQTQCLCVGDDEPCPDCLAQARCAGSIQGRLERAALKGGPAHG